MSSNPKCGSQRSSQPVNTTSRGLNGNVVSLADHDEESGHRALGIKSEENESRAAS